MTILIDKYRARLEQIEKGSEEVYEGEAAIIKQILLTAEKESLC